MVNTMLSWSISTITELHLPTPAQAGSEVQQRCECEVIIWHAILGHPKPKAWARWQSCAFNGGAGSWWWRISLDLPTVTRAKWMESRKATCTGSIQLLSTGPSPTSSADSARSRQTLPLVNSTTAPFSHLSLGAHGESMRTTR